MASGIIWRTIAGLNDMRPEEVRNNYFPPGGRKGMHGYDALLGKTHLKRRVKHCFPFVSKTAQTEMLNICADSNIVFIFNVFILEHRFC